jgi:NAD(P)-dependent dehydrogenase (short-subunit alcohol dehydrogenase family)
MAGHWIDGKTVLVTGAASGIGAAAAARLAARGAKLVLCDVEAAGLERAASACGGDALVLRADVTDLEAMHEAVRQAVERFGGIDVVWANAGIASVGPLADTDPEAWVRTVQVNLIGAFHTVRAALPEVRRARGHVAVTASLASFVNGPCLSAYAATKAGVEAMCNSLRVEVAHHGVTVGCIHPSWIATPMVLDAEALVVFRTLRAMLPPPLRRDMPLAEAAERIARGIAERRERLYLPGFVRLFRWLRTPLRSAVGERDMRRAMPEVERAFAADVAAPRSAARPPARSSSSGRWRHARHRPSAAARRCQRRMGAAAPSGNSPVTSRATGVPRWQRLPHSARARPGRC